MTRSRFLKLVAGLMLASFAPLSAAAQDAWPTRPVRIIVPYAPGGASDAIARPWTDTLSQSLGQPFVIDNKGGAGGQLGTEAAAKSAPDGYTFLLAPGSTLTLLPQLRKVPYDPGEFMPVGRVGDLVCGFAVHSALGVNSMPELLAYARANPGKVLYGSAGLGTATHMRLEMLKLRSGVDIAHVPYRGSAEALNDLLGGHVHMTNETVVLPHVKAGKMKLISINYPTRHWDYPDVPTMTELGLANADVPIWYAVWAPKGTPQAIVDAFNAEIVRIAGTPEMQARLRDISVVAPLQTPAEIAAARAEDTATNAMLIRDANIRLD